MPTTTHAAGNGVHVPTLNFVRSLLDVFAGPNHGLRVAVHGAGGSPGEHIEIIGGGRLPKQLRAGLKRAHAYWERSRRNSIPWDAVAVVWHESASGWGPRFAIPNIGVLLELVAERRALRGTRA